MRKKARYRVLLEVMVLVLMKTLPKAVWEGKVMTSDLVAYKPKQTVSPFNIIQRLVGGSIKAGSKDVKKAKEAAGRAFTSWGKGIMNMKIEMVKNDKVLFKVGVKRTYGQQIKYV